MDKIFERVLDILTVISDGGPKAIVTMLTMVLVLALVANFFLIKFVVKFFEKMTEARDKIVTEKDEIIKERMEKVEQIVAMYNKSQLDSNDAIRRQENIIHDLNNSLSTSMNNILNAVNSNYMNIINILNILRAK